MYYPRFALKIFEGLTPESFTESRIVIGHLLDCLTAINLHYLRTHPGTPKLYDSKVGYYIPPEGIEDDWQDIPTTLKLGHGDCEDLACWYAAELQHSGIIAVAVPELRTKMKAGKPFFDCHIVVLMPDGRIHDPSRVLGMR